MILGPFDLFKLVDPVAHKHEAPHFQEVTMGHRPSFQTSVFFRGIHPCLNINAKKLSMHPYADYRYLGSLQSVVAPPKRA